MDEKVIESFSDFEVKSLVRSDLFLLTSYHIYNFNFSLFVLQYLCYDLYSANEEESKLKQITNEISSDTIVEVCED